MDADLRRKERDRTLSVADLARTGDLLAMAELADGAERHALCVEWLAVHDKGLLSRDFGVSYFGTGFMDRHVGVLFECEGRSNGLPADTGVALSSVRIQMAWGWIDTVCVTNHHGNDLLFTGSLLGACMWIRENRVNKAGSP